jgi:hypothetical protein
MPPAARLTRFCATADPVPLRLNIVMQQLPIARWQHGSETGVHERLVEYSLAGVENVYPHTPPRSPEFLALDSDSSMVVRKDESSHGMHTPNTTQEFSSTPSLTYSSQNPSTYTSLRTSSVPSLPPGLLIDINGVLERPPGTLLYDCIFHFLSCTYSSASVSEWTTHNLAHFHPHAPPALATCPLCTRAYQGADGRTVWEECLAHVAAHIESGVDVRRGRVDNALVRWLWQRKVITDQAYKVLQGVVGARGNFTEYNGRERAGRRGERRY